MPIAYEFTRVPGLPIMTEDNAVGSAAIDLRAKSEHLENEVRQTIFWAAMSLVFEAKKQLDELAQLGNDWDSYGAPAPNATAVRNATTILGRMRPFDLAIARIVPSAEGGVAICFAKADRYADLEAANDGGILGVRYVGMDRPVLIETNGSEASIDSALNEIREHIRA
jgi:hypothetical protein